MKDDAAKAVARQAIQDLRDTARKALATRKIELVAKEAKTTQAVLSDAWQKEFGIAAPTPYPGTIW